MNWNSNPQLCQRGSDRLQQSPAANNIQVFVYREAGCGKNAFSRANRFRIETRGFRQLDPALDATFAGGVAIVVDDALAPGAAEDWVGTTGEDD